MSYDQAFQEVQQQISNLYIKSVETGLNLRWRLLYWTLHGLKKRSIAAWFPRTAAMQCTLLQLIFQTAFRAEITIHILSKKKERKRKKCSISHPSLDTHFSLWRYKKGGRGNWQQTTAGTCLPICTTQLLLPATFALFFFPTCFIRNRWGPWLVYYQVPLHSCTTLKLQK